MTANPMTGSPSRISHVTTAELTSISLMVTLSGADSRVSDEGVQPKMSSQLINITHFFTTSHLLAPTVLLPILSVSVMPALINPALSQAFSGEFLGALCLPIFAYSSPLLHPPTPH